MYLITKCSCLCSNIGRFKNNIYIIAQYIPQFRKPCLSLLCEAAHEDPGRLGKEEAGPSPNTEDKSPWVKVWGNLPPAPESPEAPPDEDPLLLDVVLESLEIIHEGIHLRATRIGRKICSH